MSNKTHLQQFKCDRLDNYTGQSGASYTLATKVTRRKDAPYHEMTTYHVALFDDKGAAVRGTQVHSSDDFHDTYQHYMNLAKRG